MAKIQVITNHAGTYEIWQSDGHGRSTGKPGNYSKKTTGIQIREYIGNTGYLLLATYNYPVNDDVKRTAAIEKARQYIKEMAE